MQIKSLYRVYKVFVHKRQFSVHPGPVGAVCNRTIGVNLRKSLRLDKHLSISMITETVLYLVPYED